MKKALWLALGMFFVTSTAVVFAGPHDDCTLCHGIHTGQGPVILTEPPNTTTINPRTGKPMKRIGSLCLACHAPEPDGAGYRPVDLNHTHPVGFTPDPNKVKLPTESKGFPGEEEDVVCTSCHDQHPSNTNYMYLRWPSDSGEDLPMFCAKCHPKQSSQETIRGDAEE